MNGKLNRRRLLGASIGLPFVARSYAATGALRVAALDWALAETMLALERPPAAVVAASDWSRFVVEPALPAGVADLGLQQEINLELLALLRPDLILTSPFAQDIDHVLNRIAPTRRLSIFEPAEAPLEHARALTREVAALVEAENEAERLIDQAESMFNDFAARVAALRFPPVLVASFIDARHVRVYGGAGLFQNVLDRLGVTNAWRGATGYWGFATVGVERLADSGDRHLLVISPFPGDAEARLQLSPLWQRLPFVRAGQVSLLPPVFMFGALPAALRFARLFTETMEQLGE